MPNIVLVSVVLDLNLLHFGGMHMLTGLRVQPYAVCQNCTAGGVNKLSKHVYMLV